MSSINGSHTIGDQLCNGNQEKRPLLRETPQAVVGNGISRRDLTNDSTTAIIQIPLPAPERAEPRYKPEKCKTFVAFLFNLICLFSNLVVLAYVHERVPDRHQVPPLPDLFFDAFPAMDPALGVSEVIILASMWTCLFLMVIHRYRWIVFRRASTIMGVLYAMRAITMVVTTLPVASVTYYCSPKANSTDPVLILNRALHLLTGFGLSINGQHTYCGDYIFSGHTLILTLCYLIVKEYTPTRCRLLHVTYFIITFFAIFCVLLARGHYTIDIILGYYVTSRVFWIYHSLCANYVSNKVSQDKDAREKRSCLSSVVCSKDPRPTQDSHSYQNSNSCPETNESANVSEIEDDENNIAAQNPMNYLSRVWWYPIFRYFEANVTGPVPRQYEWPLPWPRRWVPRSRIS